jgi:ribose transport system substrate-binding protein
MKRYSLTAVSFIIMLLCFFLTGCPRKSGPRSDTTIGVVFRAAYGPYTEEIERGLRDTAQEKGVRLILVVGNKKEYVDEMLSKKIQAFIIFPEDKERAIKNCIPIIVQANSKDLPVILLHSGIDEEKLKEAGAKVSSIVATDNQGGGKLAAEYLMERLNGRGKIFIMEGMSHSYTGGMREAGFNEVMKKYPDVKVITATPANNDRSRAFLVAREIFKKNPDITGVLALNGTMAMGISDAAISMKLPKMCIISFDGSKSGSMSIKEGKIDATITQSPYEIGKTGLETALKVLHGESVPPQIFVKTELITKEKLGMPFQQR